MNDADFDKMSAFSCGVAELDNFFRHEVRECSIRHYLSPYCVESKAGEIIAAFTLMNDSLMIRDTCEKDDFINDLRFETESDKVDFFIRQTSYPAINIGHLGVSINHQRNGIGMSIIALVANTYANYTQAGCQFITVDAINNQDTIKFYQTTGFSFQTNRDFYSSTRRMYRIL